MRAPARSPARVAARKQAADGVHDGEGRRARRERKTASSARTRGASAAERAYDVGSVVVDQRIHRHDVVEAAERADRACRRPGTRCCRSPKIVRQRAGARDRSGWARGRSRRPARRAAPPRPPSAPVPQPASSRRSAAHILGQPGEQRRAHRRRGRRARWRGCGQPAHPTSAASTHRPPCDRNSFQHSPRRAMIGERRHQSNPSRSKISRSFIGRVSSGSVPAHNVAARRRYSFCHRLEFRRRLHLEQRRFLQAASGGSRRDRGNARRVRRPVPPHCNLSI